MRINEVILHEELLDVKSVINSSIKKLDKVFKSNKHELRIVGGAVRDLALDKTPKDIDLATDATPDEMIAILDKANIKYKPTGLEHGTITAILDNEPFEITTLRADTETDGRHAEVEFVRSWEEDAKRRDLTYNAMSMDMEGNVFDYFNGMDDLQDKVSNFVGDADERIKEDYLRILRYFRFQGRLSTPSWNEETLKTISSNVKGLQNISAERIWQEMSKVLAGNNVANVLTHMTKSGVSKVIGLSTNDLNKVKDKGNPIIALAQMGNTTDIAKRWRLSNNESALLDFLVKNKNNSLDQKKVEDMIADGIDKNLISALVTIQGKDLNVDAEVPDFPITGADLIAKGMNPGPEMGAKLNLLKQQWKQSNFTATKDDLLKENSDLGTQRGRLEYYLKKPVEDGMLVHLSSLGKFHKDNDSLADIVPERNGTYALHPDKWESTFYSLTNKDFKKIVHYKPRLIKAPTDMIVADMAIANKFYRTDNPEEQDQLAKEYKDSIGKDVSSMKMPEVIISTSVNEDEVFVTLKKDDIVVKVPKRRVEYFLDRHYKIVEKITKDTPMGDVIKDFYKSDAPQFKGKSKAKKRQMAIAAKLSMNEAVHTFMTGHDVTFGGQKYDEMEIEVTGVDNANKKYNIMILTPKELFGKTVAVSSRYMERGPWTKTKVDNVFEGLKISSNTGFKSGFTVTLTIDDQKAGHFRYYFDDDGAQNDVEVYPEFQGKGYGKLLTLKAMTTADDYDIPFERDSRGVSKAQRGVYSSLERDGLIDNNGVTDKGYDYLEYGEKDAH
jgi:tRNA nucleotidyltransferase (CCA-adding enzyme)